MTTRRRKINVRIRDERTGEPVLAPVEFGYESTTDTVWLKASDGRRTYDIYLEEEQLEALAYLMETTRYGHEAIHKALRQVQPQEPAPYTIYESTDISDDAEWVVIEEKGA